MTSTLTVSPLPKGRDGVVKGELTCPPDKSVTHRSVIFAAMAKGRSRILYPLLGADCRSTMGVFRALGCQIVHAGDAVEVESPGWDGWTSPIVPLDFGNSGTTARLLTGVFASTPGLFVTCWGDGSLSKRPMGRVVEPLRSVGAQICGRENGRLLPLSILGTKLKAGSHLVDKATAQVKSALLLAGMNIEGETKVSLPLGSRDHTEKMLTALGATFRREADAKQEHLYVKGPFRPKARTFAVPGDPSSAAFFAVLGAIVAGADLTIRGVLENETRTGFLTILKRMGANLEVKRRPAGPNDLEPVTDLVIKGGAPLQAVDMEPGLAPTLIDEIPILAVAALFAKGESRFRGLEELRVKESDRLEKTLELLRVAGGKARAEGDDLLVEGGAKIRAFTFDPDEDHRLAMAASILAQTADGPCEIKDPECVTVSFPGFFESLSALRKPLSS